MSDRVDHVLWLERFAITKTVSAGSMTEAELIAEVAACSGLSKADAARALAAILAVLTEAFREGETVRLPGFGTFDARPLSARQGVNPRSGEKVLIPPRRVPTFRPHRALRDALAAASADADLIRAVASIEEHAHGSSILEVRVADPGDIEEMIGGSTDAVGDTAGEGAAFEQEDAGLELEDTGPGASSLDRFRPSPLSDISPSRHLPAKPSRKSKSRSGSRRSSKSAAGRKTVARKTSSRKSPTKPVRDPPRSAYGLLSSPDAVAVATAFELTVGLAKEQAAGVAGGKLTRPASSVGPYTLAVKIDADGLDLPAGESWQLELPVTADAPYPTVVLHPQARTQDVEVRDTKIEATFSVDGQTIGLAVRYTQVHKIAVPGTEPTEAKAVGVDMRVPSSLTAPDLTIQIRKWDSASGGRLRWGITSPHRIAFPDGVESDIGARPQDFAKQLVSDMSVREGQATLSLYLRGIGRRVAGKIPAEVWAAIRSAAAAKPARPPTVLLLSDEPYIPWELASFDPPLDAGAPPILGAQTVFGRWTLSEDRPPPTPPTEVDFASFAVISGVYDENGNWQRLVEAEAEAKELRKTYGAIDVKAASAEVIKCLAGDPAADVLHFAVHGRYDPDGIEQGLALVDGVMIGDTDVLGSDLPRAPLVFLNACQVGSGDEILGDYAGMAEAFLYAGAAAVIAPLWSVKDTIAKDVALSFYKQVLQKHERPAEVLMKERKAFQTSDQTSGTYLAYQFFGHPMMVLQR